MSLHTEEPQELGEGAFNYPLKDLAKKLGLGAPDCERMLRNGIDYIFVKRGRWWVHLCSKGAEGYLREKLGVPVTGAVEVNKEVRVRKLPNNYRYIVADDGSTVFVRNNERLKVGMRLFVQRARKGSPHEWELVKIIGC